VTRSQCLLVLPLAVTLAVTACVPAPHRVYFTPRISGTLSDHGRPVFEARLRLLGAGTEQDVMAVTDADGRFSFEPLSQFVMSTSLFGAPATYGYLLEIGYGGRVYPGLTHAEEGYAPPQVILDCDLARPLGGAADLHYCELR
jgi:hypothetical protein